MDKMALLFNRLNKNAPFLFNVLNKMRKYLQVLLYRSSPGLEVAADVKCLFPRVDKSGKMIFLDCIIA